MELFDFIKILFEKPEEYKKMKSYEKVKFFFMTQRFMSISFPLQAQQFNNIKVSQVETLDYWQREMTRLYKKVPGWIYVKTSGKKKAKIAMPGKEATRAYLERLGMSERDLQDAVQILGEDVLAPIKKLEKLMDAE